MKRLIPEAFRGSITEDKDAKQFLKDVEKFFTKNEKAEASSLLSKLVSMRYKGKGNIKGVHCGNVSSCFKIESTKVRVV